MKKSIDLYGTFINLMKFNRFFIGLKSRYSEYDNLEFL